jgi:hypothetical protein
MKLYLKWAAKLRKQLKINLLLQLVKVKTCCIFARSFENANPED